ncbi:MAG: hypothetical protein ABIG71_02180 [Candidatus Uhrbacteria bacterium]
MHTRTTIGLLGGVVILGAVALLSWCHVFPYEDHIIPNLSERTIAYAHVNLTRGVRRQLLRRIDVLRDVWGEEFNTTLGQAIESRENREIAAIWHYIPDQENPRLTIALWQRKAANTAVNASAAARFGDIVLLTLDDGVDAALVGTAKIFDHALVAHRTNPIQVTIKPEMLPVAELEAAIPIMESALLSASGNIHEHGLALRSDARPVYFRLASNQQLIAELTPEFLQLEVSEPSIFEDILAFFLPEQLREEAARFAGVPLRISASSAPTEYRARAALIEQPTEQWMRSFAARILPETRQHLLDGVVSSVLVANPEALSVEHKGNSYSISAEQSGKTVAISLDDDVGEVEIRIGESESTREGSTHRIPGNCMTRGLNGLRIFVQTSDPLAVSWSLDVSAEGWEYVFCGEVIR